LPDSVAIPLIIFSRQDDNLSAVNNILRNSGHAVHCLRVEHPNELDDALRNNQPELLIYFADERPDELATVVERLDKLNPSPPLLLVRSQINEQTIAEAMECGANDVVSMTHRNRFQAVVKRELAAFRFKVAFSGVASSAKQYRQELRTLMEGSAEAIADVQEGIIVAINPIWAELFGYDAPQELVNLPFMDYCSASDQPMIKGALVACLKQKWDGAPLKMNGLHADGSKVPVEINLERVSIEGDPAVRIVVAGSQSNEASPKQLVEQSLFKDPVTGFYHRHYFIDKIEERLQTDLKGGIRTIAYIRPDNFARVHDDIGMLATEKLLTRLAELIKDFMLPLDLYGRFGGTMYIALLERGTMKDVSTWAEQLRKTVEGTVFEAEQRSTSLTCTIGLSQILYNDRSTEELLSDVEKACRKGRKDGGNRVQLSLGSTATQAIRNADSIWAPRLRSALKNNQLRLMHQPIAGLADEIKGVFDTRVQMIDDHGKAVLAGEFIPVAERCGMIKNIDRWIVGASLSFCKAKNPTLVFIRLSADSINDDTLRAWLRARIQSSQVPPSKICFQVSENIAANFLKQTKLIAEMLKEDGFRFSVDQLGAGRDSNQLLSHIPMDYMKIDGSLMQGLHREPNAQTMVGDLVNTAKSLGIKTIAERIEDANTIATLWQLGIDLIQGNYVQMQDVVLEDTQSVRELSVAIPER
jgi:diguanylate cyclase (GGDEF)-like protein/PAS domain S-box-containing protein